MCPLFGVRRWPLFGGSKCIGIMGRSNGGSATVRSRGGVRSMEGPSSEVYYQSGYFACREVLLVCMATEHNCFVNPYCSHVLSDNLYPIHSIYIRSTIITSFDNAEYCAIYDLY